jgi:hypothetical protein
MPAFVPGFENDLFISYAHGDDKRWVQQLDGRAEARRLDDLMASLSATLTHLKTEHALQEVREAIQAHRRARQIPF